ncbi:MAG TPA: ATP-binding protein [Puia sp.]|nr:ATP-binding protein [Puia sp.]
MPLRKVVVIGPESTGKSTLCAALAEHFQTSWVPEYAREYLELHGPAYTYETLTVIARGQLAAEDAAVAALKQQTVYTAAAQPAKDSLLFIDTDMYVMKVWSEFVFGRCEIRVLDEIARRRYDLYLLCKTDLPWAGDAIREYPDKATRDRLYHIYKDLLVNQSTPWAEIGGQAGERLQAAIDAVSRLL